MDQLVLERGLAPSRERARALIMAGKVFVNGRRGEKAGALVSSQAEVELAAADHPYVSRGGLKLLHALSAFSVATAGRIALDVGASTGGFTDCLLQHGAAQVIAVDVGYGQLDPKIRHDPRVQVLERCNIKSLTAMELAATPDLAVIDVSFISLKQVLSRVKALLAERGEILALIKPQFEVGRGKVGRGGVVKDESLHQEVIAEISAAASALGLKVMGVEPSPRPGGPRSNQEFFIHLLKSRDDL